MDAAERRGMAMTIRTWVADVEALRDDIAASSPAWLAHREAQDALRLVRELEATLEGWAEAVQSSAAAGS